MHPIRLIYSMTSCQDPSYQRSHTLKLSLLGKRRGDNYIKRLLTETENVWAL